MKNILFLSLLFIAQSSFSQDNKDSLSSKKIQLNEVIISVNKNEEKKSETPYTVESISSKEVRLLNPQNTADMLQNTGAVFVQKSQQGGGSPVLRGFEASRVLIVVDGVRMNNAIYRAGHLQDVITIDAAVLDRTEVIFGPSSVMYGSDALGGTMHFFTKKPLFSTEKTLTKANSYVRWSSVNNEMTGHVDVNVGWKKMASLTSITYSNFGDMRSGNGRDYVYDVGFSRDYYAERINGIDSMVKNSDRNIQKHSGYSQYDILQKIAFKQNDNVLHTLNIQFSNSSNVPRYDRLTEFSNGKLRFAEWYYGPQTRLLTSLKTEIKYNNTLFDKATVILARQAISQDRISRRFKNNNKTFQMEDLSLYSLNVDLNKKITEKHELYYGLEATHNDVQSKAKSVNIVTNVESPSVTRYPSGGSTMTTYAIYGSHNWKLSEKIIISDGMRIGGSSLNAKFTDTTFFPFPFKNITQKSNSITGNLGLVLKPDMGWKISLLGSSGFRTPNVDDLTKIFDSSPGILIVANPNLKPENAYNFELGIEKICDNNIKVSLTGWYTKMTNAMVVKDFKYDGKDSILYNGIMSKVRAVQNTDNAFIQGITGTFVVDFNDHFSLLSTATYTYGRYRDVTNDTLIPLDHIPPVFGKTALSYTNNRIQAEFYAIYNGWKELKNYSPSGEDNLQYATIYGMPSWITLNLKASWQVSKNIGLQMGLENILDTHYRYFASGISAPGRNLIFCIRGNF